jgi:hypothetical protein
MTDPTPGAAPSRPFTPTAALDLSQHGGTWLLDERAESVAKAALTGAWRQAREACPEVETWGPCAPHIRVTVAFVPAHHTCRHCGEQMVDGLAEHQATAASTLQADYAELTQRYIAAMQAKEAFRTENSDLARQVVALKAHCEQLTAQVRAGKVGAG